MSRDEHGEREEGEEQEDPFVELQNDWGDGGSEDEQAPQPPLDDDAEGASSTGGDDGPIFGREAVTESPFDELRSDQSESDSEDVDLDAVFEAAFTEADADEFDEDSVWDALEDTEREDEDLGGEEHIVSTRAFCAQCEHVAEPPEVRCTYEGSEIVEFVDKQSVRVNNCPIVAQRREVGEID